MSLILILVVSMILGCITGIQILKYLNYKG